MTESQDLYGTYEETVLPHPLLLRILAEYYRNFVRFIPEKMFFPEGCLDTFLSVQARLSSHTSAFTLPQRIYRALIQYDTLAAHEQFFCQAFGITSKREEDFSQECTRIALLPQAFLCHLALMAGMSLCCQRISTTVLRQDVERIRDLEKCVPSQDTSLHNSSPYTFSLKKAFMYKGHSDHVLQHAKQDVNTHSFDALPLERRIVAWGLWCVLSCVHGAGHDALLRTLVLLGDLSTLVADIPLFSQHMGKKPCAPLPKEALSWPLVRVLLFKEITCPWEEGWRTFFA